MPNATSDEAGQCALPLYRNRESRKSQGDLRFLKEETNSLRVVTKIQNKTIGLHPWVGLQLSEFGYEQLAFWKPSKEEANEFPLASVLRVIEDDLITNKQCLL